MIHTQQPRGLVKSTVIVTVVALATLAAISLLVSLCWYAAHASTTSVSTEDDRSPSIRMSQRERDYEESKQQQTASVTPVAEHNDKAASEVRALVTRLKIEISDEQRRRGEEPNGIIRNPQLYRDMKTKLPDDPSTRAALILCVDPALLEQATDAKSQ